MTLDLNEVALYGSQIVAAASVLHASLPPVSAFQPYPRIQKGYQFIVFLIGIIAVNWRSEQQNVPSQPSSSLVHPEVVPTGNTTPQGAITK